MRETGRKSLLHFLKRRRDHCGSGGPVFSHAAVFCRIEWWADLLRKGEISWITFTIMGDPAAAQVRPALKGSLVPPDQREPLAAPVPRGSRVRPALKGSLVPPDQREPLAAPAPRGSRVRPALKGSLVPPDQREPPAVPASRGSRVRPVPKESQVLLAPLAAPAPRERFPQAAPRPSTRFRPQFTPGQSIDLFPGAADPTGNITQPSSQQVGLAAGNYLVSYKVSATLSQPGYLQVTPSWGGSAHLESGVYFATTANGSSAVGSAHFILQAPSATTFTLTYSGSIAARSGEVGLTLLRLQQTP